MILVKNFLDCPQHLPEIADWIHNEFWRDKPGHSSASMLARIRKGQRDSLPIGLAIFEGPRLLGTVSLIEADLEERPDLFPWLAALYVDPTGRSKGLGKMLVESCVREAQRVGYPALYLQTTIPQFYERLGWSVYSKVHNSDAVIMTRETRSSQGNGADEQAAAHLTRHQKGALT
jgi:predicted N-acetyltransferase YhbS